MYIKLYLLESNSNCTLECNKSRKIDLFQRLLKFDKPRIVARSWHALGNITRTIATGFQPPSAAYRIQNEYFRLG